MFKAFPSQLSKFEFKVLLISQFFLLSTLESSNCVSLPSSQQSIVVVSLALMFSSAADSDGHRAADAARAREQQIYTSAVCVLLQRDRHVAGKKSIS